jgi:hypothetical protein
MTADTGYFSPDYFAARNRFRQGAAKAGGRLEALPLKAKGPRGEELTIDIAWFGSPTPRRALVHSSGIHGVEGFAGSAIQLQLLGQFKPTSTDAALILVHVLNPYGMAWLRRVNENNVDLNRNFRNDGVYAGAPETYAKLDGLLNPASPPRHDFFALKASRFILQYGMAALKQSIVGGQYEFPRGLFFGGRQMEEGPHLYETFVRRLSGVDELTVIDVHTGIGKFAEDMVLVDSEDYATLSPRFGPRVTAIARGSRAYRPEGGVESMFFRLFSRKRPAFLGQEFGTYSGLKVMRALRDENRWAHYGGGTLDHPAKQNLKRAFCPDDEAWRRAVLNRGRELLEQAMSACGLS